MYEKDEKYLAYTDNGREYTGVNALEWAKHVEDLGAGEILLTSIDREVTGEGFDVKLYSNLKKILNIPVIAHGGASNIEHIHEVFKITNIDAVSIASILHYGAVKLLVERADSNFLEEGNIDFLKRKISFKSFGNEDIISIKNFLKENQINVRL